MKDTVYLIINPKKVDRMVKTSNAANSLYKNEIAVKLNVKVPDTNWNPPFLEKEIEINRWDEGIDIQDVDFKGQYVTDEEAEKIREHRLQKMKAVLESQGYTVNKEVE